MAKHGSEVHGLVSEVDSCDALLRVERVSFA